MTKSFSLLDESCCEDIKHACTWSSMFQALLPESAEGVPVSCVVRRRGIPWSLKSLFAIVFSLPACCAAPVLLRVFPQFG